MLKRDWNGDTRVKTSRDASPSEGLPLDRELVLRAQAGEQEAFGELYGMHYGSVFRLARFYLDHDAAEDAAAETFVRAWRALPRYRDTGVPFISWLYGIARHIVSDARKAARRAQPSADLPDTAFDVGLDEPDRLALMEAMSKLPRTERRVLELKFLVGIGNEEIASALGKTTGAVNAIRWRALRRLRGMLET